jgi:preprotein translocase subunit SecG
MPLGALSQYIFGPFLFLISFFIIAIILLQRGRGGGLTGALGGLGGQSAFGVKAGDIFTRITAIAVLIWIFTCALAARWYRPETLDIEADVSGAVTNTIGAGIGGSDAAGIPGLGLSDSAVGTDGLGGLNPMPSDGTPAATPPSSPADSAPALQIPDGLKPAEPAETTADPKLPASTGDLPPTAVEPDKP